MIQFKNVSIQFKAQTVLKNVSFTVPQGNIFFVIGRSGTGKSVLLKLAVGLLKPDQGQIFIENEEITPLSEEELYPIRRKCGLVFQLPALLESYTVLENLSFGFRSESKIEVRHKILNILDLLRISPSVLSRYPSHLGFSLKKRISLARTLVLDPKILLLDEPTTAQDPIMTRLLDDLILSVSKTLGLTVVVVSHDMGSAMELADEILFLDNGEVLLQGAQEKIQSSPLPLVKAFLQEAQVRGIHV